MKSVPYIVDLAWGKFRDAELLLQEGRADSAFYLAGYTIELMLKAMICKRIKIESFFDFGNSVKQLLSKEAYRPFKVHDFFQLAVLAGLYNDWEGQTQNAEFNEHWSIIREWSQDARYINGKPAANVANFLNSVKIFSEWIEKRLFEV